MFFNLFLEAYGDINDMKCKKCAPDSYYALYDDNTKCVSDFDC